MTRRLAPLVLVALLSCSSPNAPYAGEASAPGPGAGATAPDAPSLGGGASTNDGGLSAPTADAATGPVTTTIRVHYPATSHSIALRGSVSPWTWTKGATMTPAGSDTWTVANVAGISAPFEFKPLLDDTTWSLGPNYKAAPGTTVDIYPRFMRTAGQHSRAFDFPSAVLGNTRGIWIYLPPTYVENSLAPMPVLYMHDGQNLFDASAAFGGNTWKVAETMDAGAVDGSIAEAIVVGIENTSDRMSEYTPVPDPADGGGNADAYLRMIVDELKPKVDSEMRTLPDRAHTAMMGSSLGGLVSAYAGVMKADVFGLVGVMSPSTWWDNQWIIGKVATTPAATRPLRVYVDSGDSGDSNDDVTETQALAAEYVTIGYKKGTTLDYVVQAGGQHNEVFWAQRLPAALAFLLGPGR